MNDAITLKLYVTVNGTNYCREIQNCYHVPRKGEIINISIANDEIIPAVVAHTEWDQNMKECRVQLMPDNN